MEACAWVREPAVAVETEGGGKLEVVIVAVVPAVPETSGGVVEVILARVEGSGEWEGGGVVNTLGQMDVRGGGSTSMAEDVPCLLEDPRGARGAEFEWVMVRGGPVDTFLGSLGGLKRLFLLDVWVGVPFMAVFLLETEGQDNTIVGKKQT